MNHVACGDN